MFGNDSDSDSDSDSDDDAEASRGQLLGRARWLKKETTVAKSKVKKAASTKPKEEGAKVVAAVRRPVAEIVLTLDDLHMKLGELMASRGRKGTDSKEVLRKLEVLSRGARKFGPHNEIPVLMLLISSMYDGARGIDDFMDVWQWRTCYRSLARIGNLLNAQPELCLGAMPSEDVSNIGANVFKGAREEKDESDQLAADPNVVNVVGSLGGFVQRLEDEYTKALQQINPHTSVRDPYYLLCLL
jgi:translation initiation factor 3 subunit C